LLTISCLDSHTARQLKKLFDGGMTLVYCEKSKRLLLLNSI
jgi:hypothetical protein